MTMRRLLPLLLLVAGAALAQPPHAMLTGTARSARRGVAGVTVTITSPALQGSRTTTTVSNGDYFFDALPPGTYDIQFAKKGFATVTHRGVLTLGETARVDAELQPSQEEESVTATGTTTTVLETPQIATILDATLVDQLPIRRTIPDRATLAPGDGGLLSSNSVDGMLRFGFFDFPDVVEESIQQTTVITGAAGPEYGRTIGGVVLTATRSGGNEFSGSFRDTLTSDRWRARVPNLGPRSNAIHHSLEATVGGKLVADRIWFFLAGGHLHQENERQWRDQAKITAAPTAAASVVATWLHADNHIGDNFSPGFGETQNAGSIDATTMAGPHALIEAMASRWRDTVPFAATFLPDMRDVLLRGSWIDGSQTITAGFSDTRLESFRPERALFANDRLDFGTHWLFNAGARVIDTMSRSRFFEPRVSAIFDVHGDGHSRWSIAFGQYLESSFIPSEVNETTLSYAMQIGGNGFLRVDGWYRQGALRSEGIDFQGSYRFLGLLDAGGNYTWLQHAFLRNRANLWLRVNAGRFTVGVLEQYETRLTSGVALQYAISKFFAKGDLLNAFDVGQTAPREFRLALGARF